MGWVNLAAVLDLKNKEVIGYEVSKNIDSELCKRALAMAVIKCPECQKDVSDSAVSCPFCGYGVEAHVKREREEKQAYEKFVNTHKPITFTEND